MSLAFRNVDASPDDPVAEWPLEGVLAALERGGLSHWRRLAAEIRRDPWGPVARAVEQALAISRPYGVGELMTGVLAQARREAEAAERAEVARRVAAMIATSGLTRAEFARRIGTSASRLSTYESGTVMLSAALLVRMERLATASAEVGSE
jgi:DNA-binding transcriptional regulator YiaG